MRNTQPENDAEHSLQVAMIAHFIAIIGRDQYARPVNPEHVLSLAVYHDATEVMTGDLPTPVKYHSKELRDAYRRLEFSPYLKQSKGYDSEIVKAADKISAYIKCLEEIRAGNHEFDYAAENIRQSLETVPWPEVKDFMRDYLPAFSMTLDELNHPTV